MHSRHLLGQKRICATGSLKIPSSQASCSSTKPLISSCWASLSSHEVFNFISGGAHHRLEPTVPSWNCSKQTQNAWRNRLKSQHALGFPACPRIPSSSSSSNRSGQSAGRKLGAALLHVLFCPLASLWEMGSTGQGELSKCRC